VPGKHAPQDPRQEEVVLGHEDQDAVHHGLHILTFHPDVTDFFGVPGVGRKTQEKTAGSSMAGTKAYRAAPISRGKPLPKIVDHLRADRVALARFIRASGNRRWHLQPMGQFVPR
jgi:hypothetical protein